MNKEFEEEGLAFESLYHSRKNRRMDGQMQAVIYSNGNLECERAKTLLENLIFRFRI